MILKPSEIAQKVVNWNDRAGAQEASRLLDAESTDDLCRAYLLLREASQTAKDGLEAIAENPVYLCIRPYVDQLQDGLEERDG